MFAFRNLPKAIVVLLRLSAQLFAAILLGWAFAAEALTAEKIVAVVSGLVAVYCLRR